MLQPQTLQLCHKALLGRGFASAGKRSHELLMLGDVVQDLLSSSFEGSKFISSPFSMDGSSRFFIIGGFYNGFYKSQLWHSLVLVKQWRLISPITISQLPDCNRISTIEMSTEIFILSETHFVIIFLSSMMTFQRLALYITAVNKKHVSYLLKQGACITQLLQ